MFVERLPPDLAQQVAKANDATRAAANARDLEQIATLQEGVYAAMLQEQRDGHRFHKGGPLMSVGSALLARGETDTAFDWILRAFVEDVLSRAEESPDEIDEIGRPAAMALLFSLGVRGPSLIDLAVRLRSRVAEGKLWQRPEDALRDEPLAGPSADTVSEQSQPARAAIEQVSVSPLRVLPWRVPGLYGTHYEERVFVGGSYGSNAIGTLVTIRDTLREIGLDGVLAAEFKRPRATAEVNYDDALLLLRSCKWAVFDVTERSGQLHEVQDAVSLGMSGRVLLLRSAASPRPSDMTAGAARGLGTRIRTFAGPVDLQDLVRTWAQRRRRART